ncbi:MAG: hypothetical protein GF393_04015 [Armatimonadia bacterium]|nr:hypothetical protein [Armatimonadia bacterium]
MDFRGTIRIISVGEVVPTKNSQLIRFEAHDEGGDGEKYVEYIAWGGLAEKISSYKPGDVLEVSGYIKSRSWKERNYTDAVLTAATGKRDQETAGSDDEELPF